MSQINEEYKPGIKSKSKPIGLRFVKAQACHVQAVFELMFQRNPKLEKENLYRRVEKEILEISNGVDYGVYVALLKGKVVGFCRFFSSENTPLEKAKYDYVDGIYCMGIIVNPDYRRIGIAEFLSDKRLEVFKSLNVKEVFSLVAMDNPTSISMHRKFGFDEIKRASGFFIVSFDCGEGISFRKKIH